MTSMAVRDVSQKAEFCVEISKMGKICKCWYLRLKLNNHKW